MEQHTLNLFLLSTLSLLVVRAEAHMLEAVEVQVVSEHR
jgi:hypothetical protein